MGENSKIECGNAVRGHEFTAENTYYKSNGTRACRQCMRIWNKNRGPRGAEHWRAVNAKRKHRRG